jgi:nitrite reductase/ring-hydroxylating ferredoxin subunit
MMSCASADGSKQTMISSGTLQLLCAAADVPPGTAKKLTVGDLTVAVFNLDGDFYVTDDTCTHGFASLSEGFIEDGIIECPWHGGAFDIRSGFPVEHPWTVPLRVYRTAVRDGEVWAELDGSPETS